EHQVRSWKVAPVPRGNREAQTTTGLSAGARRRMTDWHYATLIEAADDRGPALSFRLRRCWPEYRRAGSSASQWSTECTARSESNKIRQGQKNVRRPCRRFDTLWEIGHRILHYTPDLAFELKLGLRQLLLLERH